MIAFLIFSLFALTAVSCAQETVSAKDKVLFDFETDSELNRFGWKCRSRFEISSDFSNTGKSSLRFEFHPASRIGFSTGDVPHDWSIYKSFDFWVYNPSGSQVPLHLEVNRRGQNGKLSSLKSITLEVCPGENIFSIPLDAPAGSENIASSFVKVSGFFIFMQNIMTPTALYFDSFKLITGNFSG